MSESSSYIYRHSELQTILQTAARAQCLSLVGVSNVGKSELLRQLCDPHIRRQVDAQWEDTITWVYIDCNRMLGWDERAFYELILRELLHFGPEEGAARGILQDAYQTQLDPPNAFLIPHSFNQALSALLEKEQRRIVFIFDEFDAAYRALDARVLLNLRALKDRYAQAVTYVVATDQRLSFIRSDEQVDEFKELFGLHVHYIQPLAEPDARHFIKQKTQQLGAHFDENDLRFVLQQAGGHPALLDITCQRLAAVTGEAHRSESEDRLIHREVEDQLRQEFAINAECDKIWRDLSEPEQDVLNSFFLPDVSNDMQALTELRRRGILIPQEGDDRFFAALFADYVRRRNVAQHGPDRGVRMDVEKGEVYVNGQLTEPLTNLEFRLLLLLYGRLNKICDKYSIVTAVWGEDYVDDVYDSAIEKLVSRVRRKIEPDPSSPRYLQTVRGRGYKLVS